jgi:hypothetical protein
MMSLHCHCHVTVVSEQVPVRLGHRLRLDGSRDCESILCRMEYLQQINCAAHR